MIDYSRYKLLKVTKKDKVALLALNRPEKLNAVNYQMHLELEDVWEDLAKDDEVNAIVLTGEGRAFCSGGDMKGMRDLAAKDASVPRLPPREVKRMVNNILNLEKPVIAAINGDALGIGSTIALLCDVIFMSENARIADNHVNAGLTAGDGGCLIWPLLIGVARAKQYLMTGDFVSAREAEQMGLVNKVVPQSELLPTALAFAQRLANGPVDAINWTKISINEFLKHNIGAFHVSLAAEYLSLGTADHAEATRAFVEKRKPRFTGR